MKKLFTLIGLSPLIAMGQSLVYTTPENRTALLEEFTAIHCGYCPEGHVISANLEATLKDRIVVVGVHAGSLAVPQAGQPDFRTSWGTTLDSMFNTVGYPSAPVNRRAYSGALDLNRGQWEAAANAVLGLSSPVNLGMESSYDAGTHQLTVHVHALYTADSPGGNDRLSVLIKENHIDGFQEDYTYGAHPHYDHVNVLRAYITPTWGEDVGSHVAGDEVDRTYTYTIPSAWNIANCDAVAFIGEYQSEVYQARSVAAVDGTTLVIGDLAGDAQPFKGGANGGTTNFDGGFTNVIGADEQYAISFSSANAPAGWAANFTADGTTYVGSASVTVASGASLSLITHVVPDAGAGVGDYLLRVTSVTHPGAPALEHAYHVISGVHDLVVTNPGAEAQEPVYVDGLVTANEGARGATTREFYLGFAQGNALGDVNNLYLNVSWTFPSLTDDLVGALASFMDAGGNVMIAGQDIGWDQSGDANAYGTATTQQFYHTYLLANFVADGSTANTSVDFDDADAVFGTVPNGTINSVFGTNTYPDHITPIAPAVAILHYNDQGIGGLRAQTATHKLVYFGIGPEQMTDANVAHQMVQLSHDWFYGTVGIEEFDAAINALGQAYPSPANDRVNIPLGATATDGTLEVYDATGRLVSSQRVSASSAVVSISVAALGNGSYSARLRSDRGVSRASSFVVTH